MPKNRGPFQRVPVIAAQRPRGWGRSCHSRQIHRPARLPGASDRSIHGRAPCRAAGSLTASTARWPAFSGGSRADRAGAGSRHQGHQDDPLAVDRPRPETAGAGAGEGVASAGSRACQRRRSSMLSRLRKRAISASRAFRSGGAGPILTRDMRLRRLALGARDCRSSALAATDLVNPDAVGLLRDAASA